MKHDRATLCRCAARRHAACPFAMRIDVSVDAVLIRIQIQDPSNRVIVAAGDAINGICVSGFVAMLIAMLRYVLHVFN